MFISGVSCVRYVTLHFQPHIITKLQVDNTIQYFSKKSQCSLFYLRDNFLCHIFFIELCSYWLVVLNQKLLAVCLYIKFSAHKSGWKISAELRFVLHLNIDCLENIERLTSSDYTSRYLRVEMKFLNLFHVVNKH